MDILLELVAWALMILGSAMLIIGAVGVVRLPDMFARMHGAGIIDTLGLGAVFVGLMIEGGLSAVTLKLALILVFVQFTSPTTTHALARAALNGGVRPAVRELVEETPPADGEPAGTAPQEDAS